MSACVLSLLLSFGVVWADEGPLDELGCHQNLERTEYHCHAGALAGARYPSRASAEQALTARAHARPAKRGSDDPLNIVVWPFTDAPRDVERVASPLADADVAVLRGLGGKTHDALLAKLTASLDARTHHRHCRGRTKDAAFVWRDEDVYLVTPDGALVDGCAARSYDLSPSAAVFGARAGKHLFTIGGVTENWPALVYDDTFASATKLGLKPIAGPKPVGAWTRGLFVVEVLPATLGELYPDLRSRDLGRLVGRFAPTTLRLSFTEPSVDTLQMVKRDAKPRREIASEPSYESYPESVDSNNLSVPEDDLESEERASRPKSPAKPKKTHKRR